MLVRHFMIEWKFQIPKLWLNWPVFCVNKVLFVVIVFLKIISRISSEFISNIRRRKSALFLVLSALASQGDVFMSISLLYLVSSVV